jgi:hypothetical protein
MKKFGLLSLALVLALGTLGIGYATWSDNVTIVEEVNSGHLCVEFRSCDFNDEGVGLDETVGSRGCPLDADVSLCGEWFECKLDKDIGSGNCTYVDEDGDLFYEVLVVQAKDIYPGYLGVVDYSCVTAVPYHGQSIESRF